MIEVLVMSVLPVALAMRPEAGKDEFQLDLSASFRFDDSSREDLSALRFDDGSREPAATTRASAMETSIEITLEESQSFWGEERMQM
ncbi:unnamed protein product [Cylindrotheca closterium]|uniref:Uncharacterized protein n=1 Tax=Cylindrotheca closterium TaxID=2856 RepID=A0AAD2FY97_9STRA|nr:unnamed protein product [Cylindrotheca closterium]